MMFLRCEIGDGETAYFWHDSWSKLGPLITYLGARGTRQLQIPLDGRVIQATRNGDWRLPVARSNEAQSLQIHLTTLTPPNVSMGPDSYLWRNATGMFVKAFSSKATWEHLRIQSPTVLWHKVVWFKEAILRCSFITWLVMLSRLPTKDRLRRWGINVPDQCVLCSSGIETHEHLFFDCPFASDIWSHFASRIWSNLPLSLQAVVSWISQPHLQSYTPQAVLNMLIKLLLQIIIYILWKERNARIFSTTSTSATSLRLSVDRMVRDRLLSFPATSSASFSLLRSTFFVWALFLKFSPVLFVLVISCNQHVCNRKWYKS